jgi:hypothetical protein
LGRYLGGSAILPIPIFVGGYPWSILPHLTVIAADPCTGFGGMDKSPKSGILPSTTAEPSWWYGPVYNNEAAGFRSVKDEWDGDDSTLVVVPH